MRTQLRCWRRGQYEPDVREPKEGTGEVMRERQGWFQNSVRERDFVTSGRDMSTGSW